MFFVFQILQFKKEFLYSKLYNP